MLTFCTNNFNEIVNFHDNKIVGITNISNIDKNVKTFSKVKNIKKLTKSKKPDFLTLKNTNKPTFLFSSLV